MVWSQVRKEVVDIISFGLLEVLIKLESRDKHSALPEFDGDTSFVNGTEQAMLLAILERAFPDAAAWFDTAHNAMSDVDIARNM